MKINKRECRKFADPGLKMNQNHGLLHAEEVKYIVRTAVKNIGGKRLLVLYIYLREQAAAGNFKPVLTMFQSRTEYITLCRREDGSTRWSAAAFCNLQRDYDFSRQCAFYMAGDEERVTKFCKRKAAKGFISLYYLQSDISEKRQRERKLKKEKEIRERMKTVSALPRNIRKMINREIMPHYLFYSYNRKRTDMEGFCSACKTEVLVTGARHNKKGVCPVCKAKVTFKSRGKRGMIIDRDTLQVIQRTSGNEIVVRFLKSYSQYGDERKPYISVYENARTFLSWDDTGNISEECYYYSYGNRNSLTPWQPGSRPVFSRWQYNFEADQTGFLYEKNLDKVLKGSPWQYSQLKEFYLAEKEPLYAIQYFVRYNRYPMLEYLVKLHLYRLAESVAHDNHYYSSDSGFNPNGKNLKEAFGLDKSHLPLLKRVNPGLGQMKLIRAFLHANLELDEELLRWCGNYNISRAENVLVPLKHMTPYKLMKYVNEQYAKFCKTSPYQSGGYYKMEDILTDYRDYLCMSEGLELDLKNSFVLFPADLKKAHDKVNDISDKEQALVYDRQIQKQFEEMNQQYHFVKYGFAVLLPHTAKEILEEGQNLHHCVGSYVKKVVKRESTILFVRKASEQSKSLCTVEIQNGELVQARCYGNQSPSPAVRRFLDVWEKEILHAPALAAAA